MARGKLPLDQNVHVRFFERLASEAIPKSVLGEPNVQNVEEPIANQNSLGADPFLAFRVPLLPGDLRAQSGSTTWQVEPVVQAQ
jgi:hypothetical protein